MLSILSHTLRRRRVGLLWWSVGLAALAGLLALAFPTMRGNSELDSTFSDLPAGVEKLLGLAGGNPLTSPIGYLNSQFYANSLPIVLLIFAVGLAAWTVAGDEAAGTFELLVTNPISRVRVALARFGATALLLGILALVGALTIMALAPSTGLDEGIGMSRFLAATLAGALLALVFAAIAFAVGAATGNRSAALGAASAVAVVGYVMEGLAEQVSLFHTLRFVNPWHWLLATDWLSDSLAWYTWAPPILATAVLVGGCLPLLAHRDLRG